MRFTMPDGNYLRTLNKFGTLYNGQIQQAKHVHLHTRYRVHFIGYGVSGESTWLTANMQKFTPPQGAFESVKVPYVNGEVKYAGKWTWSDITFNVLNSYDNSVERALQNQLQRQKDTQEQTTGDAPSGYKFTTVFERTDGHQITLARWVLEGCFLIDAKEDEASNEDYQFSQIACTMSYDNAVLYDGNGVLIPTTTSAVIGNAQEALLY